MSRIQHPQPQVGIVTDRLGGIEFTDGVAEVDLTDKPNLREAYWLHGYTVEEVLEGELDGTPGALPEYVEGDTTERVFDEPASAGIAEFTGHVMANSTAPVLDYLGYWTKAKLVAYAADQGIDLGAARTKAQILYAIAAVSPDAIVTEG